MCRPCTQKSNLSREYKKQHHVKTLPRNLEFKIIFPEPDLTDKEPNSNSLLGSHAKATSHVIFEDKAKREDNVICQGAAKFNDNVIEETLETLSKRLFRTRVTKDGVLLRHCANECRFVPLENFDKESVSRCRTCCAKESNRGQKDIPKTTEKPESAASVQADTHVWGKEPESLKSLSKRIFITKNDKEGSLPGQCSQEKKECSGSGRCCTDMGKNQHMPLKTTPINDAVNDRELPVPTDPKVDLVPSIENEGESLEALSKRLFRTKANNDGTISRMCSREKKFVSLNKFDKRCGKICRVCRNKEIKRKK